MADISALGELRPVETVDLSDTNYKDQQDGPRLPAAGTYTLRAPDSFPKEAFGRARSGALSAQIDPVIVGGPSDGYKVKFTRVSAKTFKRSGITVSQLGDYLRATGFRGRLTDEQAQADAVAATANVTYQAVLDWRAYNKDTGFSLEGMENFPSDGNGGHKPWCEDPNAKDEQGNPVRLRANLNVVKFIPASN